MTVLSELDDRVDELEDEVLGGESYELRAKIGSLRRETISLRRYLAPQRDAVARLQNERVPWLDEVTRVHLREIADRTTRYVEDLDSARDRAAVTQDELNSRLSERMNKTMYVLSIVAGIFLPLGLLTGLLGINVGGIPGHGELTRISACVRRSRAVGDPAVVSVQADALALKLRRGACQGEVIRLPPGCRGAGGGFDARSM